MDNFIRETRLWSPHRSPLKLGRQGKVARDFILEICNDLDEFILVFNYEIWRKDPKLLDDLISLKVDTLICDEAHRAKSLQTIQGKGVQKLRYGFNQCPNCEKPKIVWASKDQTLAKCSNCTKQALPVGLFSSVQNFLALTGTPILNKPQEIYPQLRLIDIQKWYSEKNFLRNYCKQSVGSGKWSWQYGAEKRLARSIGNHYLARKREDTGVVVPPVQYIEHVITMDELKEKYPNQHRAYRQTKDYAQLVMNDNNEVMSMPEWITVLLRLRQVLTWPAAIELRSDETVTRLDVHESAKIDLTVGLIREINKEGDRVVLFSQFSAPLRELEQRLGVRSVTYSGNTTPSTRNEIQQDFDARSSLPIPRWDNVLCNYKAAGEGLNLTAANHMIILDKEWNPGRQSQAQGRIDRIGQKKFMQIHNITVKPSIDQWLDKLIEEKRNLTEGLSNALDLQHQFLKALREGELG